MKRSGAVTMMIVMALTGCDRGLSEPDSAAVGSYSLRSVLGQAVPYIGSQSPTFRSELIGGSLELLPDHRYLLAITWRYTENGVVSTRTSTEEGTWSIAG